MIIELREPLIQSLLEQPESGMGWQLVDARFAAAPPERMIALNAEFLASESAELRSLAQRGELTSASLKQAARQWRTVEVKSLSVVARSRSVREGRVAPGPAADAPETHSDTGDEFRRFSAFENDRRVTTDSGLLPGTYATTSEDGDLVETGMDAVARYALPNPMPAKYEFVIRPPPRGSKKASSSP